jgi:hypothetical protein|tara:strand:- start:7424 stop:8776 length:1353 start_codon:yes stop_codon:yes gene_type:complete
VEKTIKKTIKKTVKKTSKKTKPPAHTDSNLAKLEYRAFNFSKDIKAIKRIWREIGWVTEDVPEQAMDIIFAVDDTVVGCINGNPECSVLAQSGTMRLDQTDLPLSVIAAVTTSRIGRGLGFAQNLTAWQLARGAKKGAAVAALGMFDQGFYNKVGFGTGAYTNEFAIDPSSIDVSVKPRTPSRLTEADSGAMLKAMVNRPRKHGAVVIDNPQSARAECLLSENSFGLGYFSGKTLTHFIWLSGEGEHGPYTLEKMGYSNGEQLLELLALLKSLADQIYSIKLREPPEIQLQSMLKRPFREQAIAEKGKYYAEQNTYAWYQLRILDVPVCVAAVSFAGPPVRFNLSLTDPVTEILNTAKQVTAKIKEPWTGVGGDYSVALGTKSKARLVSADKLDKTLPTLSCSVNTFSRLLWGVAPATSLAISDGLQAPHGLLLALDPVFKTGPNPVWDF